MSALRILLVCLFTTSLYGQVIDSIKYDQGYLYFHNYGDKEVIILLTGGPGNGYSQLHEVAMTLGKKYKVILPEQRGTGRSIPAKLDTTTINVAALTNDVKLLLQHLKVSKATIIGHSWGAMLAMNFASQHPSMVKSLILVCPGPHADWNTQARIIQTNMRSRLGQNELKTLDSLMAKMRQGQASLSDSINVRKIFRSAYIFDKAKLETLFPKLDVKSYPVMQQLILQDVSRNFDMTQPLKNYKGAVHIISGRQDIIAFSTYELKLVRPSAIVHWIEESGHFPMYEQPDRFYKIIFSLLEKH